MSIPRPPDDSFTATRESLLTRLKHWDDTESWQEFFETYGGLLYRFALRSGLDDGSAQDAVQDIMLAVAKQMPDFRYDPSNGSFRAWLYQQARWRIADILRRRQRSPLAEPLPDESGTHTNERWDSAENDGAGTEAAWDKEWRENQLARALERVRTRVSPRQFQMFHLAAVQGWPMADITRTLGVNRAQVYMAKLRMGRLLREELARLQE
ncbi:MAG TPA: sigma-70 family RNA polymerase sigma factor [Verrucomicrobiota bacterium]|nr:sigma-70 family RNA polymerase sigma factor [Verrucomicrobiota bacterium]